MEEQQEIETFVQDLEARISQKVFENGLDNSATFREEVFTEDLTEILVEYGELEDAEICFFEQDTGKGKLRINGYSINSETNKVTLITSLYESEPLSSVAKGSLLTAIQRAVRVFEIVLYRNDYYEELEPATKSYDMMQHLSSVAKDTENLSIIVLTNGKAANLPDEIKLPDLSCELRWSVWDSVRLARCLASDKAYETISIKLKDFSSEPLSCLKMPQTNGDYDAYLVIFSGDLLYRLYEQYSTKLLELNVRCFLQARGKVNRGIRDTIRTEPSRFMAYNNGISATAEKLVTEKNAQGGLEIYELDGFQVVNGGQTMASIHRARKDDQADLSKIFVQAKITVIKPEHINDLVPLVSRFANTQNKVNEADFSANDSFHIEIERLSEKIWCPGEQSRWFYERARGQYQVARNRLGTTPAKRRQFDEAMPSSKKIDKTQLAKYYNTWMQLPHIVSRGNQKNFVYFMTELKKYGDSWVPDELFYKNLIASAIVFKKAESIARQHKFPAYRANAVTYTVALLCYRTLGRINVDNLWENQELSTNLGNTIYDWMQSVYDEILRSAQNLNVTEWCKKEECWRSLQTLDIEIPDGLQNELAEGQPLPTVGSIKGQTGESLTNEDRENIAKTMQLSGENWLKIHTSVNHPVQRGIALTLSGYAANEWQKVPSKKQAKSAVKMIMDAEQKGIFDSEVD
jgi:hypothetical protein